MYKSISRLSVQHIKAIMTGGWQRGGRDGRDNGGGDDDGGHDGDDGYFCVVRGSCGGAETTAAAAAGLCCTGEQAHGQSAEAQLVAGAVAPVTQRSLLVAKYTKMRLGCYP